MATEINTTMTAREEGGITVINKKISIEKKDAASALFSSIQTPLLLPTRIRLPQKLHRLANQLLQNFHVNVRHLVDVDAAFA